MIRSSTRVVIAGLALALFWTLPLAADEAMVDEEDVIYIDDYPELDPLSQRAEEPEKPVPATINLKSIRFAMPYLGTENWWKGTWGVGLEWTAAHSPSSWAPLALRGEYAFSSLGFEGSEGIGNYASLGLLWKPDRGIDTGAGARGLVASDATRSWIEAPLGFGYQEVASGLPWRGAWLSAGFAPGMGGNGDTWLKALASYEHLLHVVESRVIVAPRAAFAASAGEVPLSRRFRMRNGRFEAGADIGMGSPLADGALRSCLALSLETRFMIPLYAMGGGEKGGGEILLGLGLKPWLYAEDIVEHGWEATWKSGLSLSCEFGALSFPGKEGGVQSYTSPFGAELVIPFATVDRLETWALSFKTFLDPVELFGL
jgi:hypothetical protein